MADGGLEDAVAPLARVASEGHREGRREIRSLVHGRRVPRVQCVLLDDGL